MFAHEHEEVVSVCLYVCALSSELINTRVLLAELHLSTILCVQCLSMFRGYNTEE
jgi:hypothetical protein